MKVSYLDCCSDPDVEGLKVILDTNREREGLVRCKTCRAYWYHRFLEIMHFDRPDNQTVWYSPVTKKEAKGIMEAQGRSDLSFLLTRPSFEKDDQGVRRVSGAPDKPLYG
jgi:hypothetical protein